MIQANPLVSIIVPVYKVEPYLDRCVESILAQTYANLEIILVDDGSPDRSGAMCDTWAEKDSRIRAIHQENGGLSSARNSGIEQAVGQYLIFVDSDDFVSPNMTEHLLALCQDYDADIAIGEVCHIFGEGEGDFTSTTDVPVCYNRVEAIRQLWYQKSFLPGAWAKIYRREIFREHRFTEGILFEDIDIMHRLFWSSNKLVYQSSPVYGYLHREGSITTAAFSVRNGDILPIAEKLLDFARSYCPELLPAAQSYAVSAAFRILLNAPEDHPELETLRSQAGQLLDACKASVRKDPQIRRKTRYALYLYDICPALMKLIYKRKNRWK